LSECVPVPSVVLIGKKVTSKVLQTLRSIEKMYKIYSHIFSYVHNNDPF
jgi:20S proteasome alpha/beta subunit